MGMRYWLILTLTLTLTASVGVAELSTSRVVGVEFGEEVTVVIAAGQQAGLGVDADVTILREGLPIVHPLTAVVLGIPQEPVGVGRVVGVEPHQATVVLLRRYSMPQLGDVVEFRKMVSELDENTTDNTTNSAPPLVLQRMRQLEDYVAESHKSVRHFKEYPAFARQVWDELTDIKSYLVSLDERVVELEERQYEDHSRLLSSIAEELHSEDYQEFTIRYDPGTEIKLSIAGRTLTLGVVSDTLNAVMDAEVADDLQPKISAEAEQASWWSRLFSREKKQESDGDKVPEITDGDIFLEGYDADTALILVGSEEPTVDSWYTSPWVAACVILLFVLTGAFVFYNKVTDSAEHEPVGEFEEESDEEEYEEEEAWATETTRS